MNLVVLCDGFFRMGVFRTADIVTLPRHQANTKAANIRDHVPVEPVERFCML